MARTMSWVRTFATEDAIRLIQEGGKRGVDAIVEIIIELYDSVMQFIGLIDDSASTLPEGLRQRRVKNPLNEVVEYLLEVENLAEKIAYS